MISSIVNNEVLLIVTFLVILLRDALHSIFSVRAVGLVANSLMKVQTRDDTDQEQRVSFSEQISS